MLFFVSVFTTFALIVISFCISSNASGNDILNRLQRCHIFKTQCVACLIHRNTLLKKLPSSDRMESNLLDMQDKSQFLNVSRAWRFCEPVLDGANWFMFDRRMLKCPHCCLGAMMGGLEKMLPFNLKNCRRFQYMHRCLRLEGEQSSPPCTVITVQ